jgi:hypothetical protein
VRFGPVVFWIVVGTVTLLSLWSAATATYFAFRDDVLTRLIARQAEMLYAYEDRIAELRAKVDRAASRQLLLDQEQFDQKLEQLMRRQAALEARTAALGAMPDVTGSIKPPVRGAPTDKTTGAPKPSPISDAIFVAPPDREAPPSPRVRHLIILRKSRAPTCACPVAAVAGPGREPADRCAQLL